MLQLERERPGAPFFIAISAHAIIIFVAIWKGSIALPDDAGPLEHLNQAESAIDIIFFPERVPGAVMRKARAVQQSVPTAPEYRVPELSEGSLVSLHREQSVANGIVDWAMPAVPQRDTATESESFDELASRPRFTSFSRAPRLTNEKDIQRFLTNHFPPDLRSAGGHARAVLWLLIDARGQVFKALLRDTSGRAEADSLAVAAGYLMSFDPAEQAGLPVPVWVQQPIRFQVRDVF